MSLLNRIDYPVLTPQSALLEALNRPTTFGEYLGAKVSQGFEGSIAGRLYEGLTEPGPNLPEVEVMGQTVPNPAYRPEAAMTKEQYQASPYFREGVDYQEGMTEPLAAARADAYDSRRYRDQLIARYKGGLLGQVAGFGAAVLGGLPSPENFVPFVGPAERAAMVARLGWLGGHAAAGIADATLGTALADPIVMGDLNRRGEDFGAMDFAADLALGAVAGGLLGTASGFLTRGERLAQTGQAIRLDGLQRQADALEGALQSVTRDEPVQVGPIAAPEPAAVARLDQAVASDRVFTPTGRQVDVRYEVVEARDLVTSHTDAALAPNPAYPAELQPRDRGRAASAEQVQSIAANLQPELLGRSATAGEGAPIVGDGNVVESGNGRVLALRRAYQEGMPGAAAYREWLGRQGYDTRGMEQPVLVRRRTTPMTPQERQSFTLEANQRTTAAMGTAELALADARALDDRMMALVQSPDMHAAGNRAFVRAFAASLPQAERADLLTADGELSRAGAERLRTALLARAYGDAGLVARLAQEPESGLGTLGSALVDASPEWARMRAEAEGGAIAPEGDATAGILDAVRAIVRERDAGNPLHFALSQADLFAGDRQAGLSIEGRAFLRAMLAFDKKGNSRLAGRQKIAELLRDYLAAARKQRPGTDMFGARPLYPEQILIEQGRIRPEVGAPLRADELGPDALATALGVAKREQPFTDLDGLYERAPKHQAALGEAGRSIAEGEAGVRFKDPGLKERATTEEKLVRKRYSGPKQLTDVVRAGFEVATPADAERVVDALAGRFRVLDEGWNRTEFGYFDRKVLLVFEDGTIGEVQLWEPHLLEAKTKGGGYKLYEEHRALPVGDPRQRELENGMREIYARALAEADPAWATMLQPGGGPAAFRASRNIEAQTAGSSMTEAVLPTSELSTSVHDLAQPVPSPVSSTANAFPVSPERTAGLPSQFERTIAPGIATSPTPQVTPARRGVNLEAVAREEQPRPSVLEAASKLKEKPKDAVAEAKALAQDMGLAPAKGQAEAAGGAAAAPVATDPDIAALRRAGKLTEADEASLKEADELVKTADGWATAYESLAGCVLRFGE